MKLENKNIIITGGSSGIGKGIANICATKGANVIIIARRQCLLDSALKEIGTNRASDGQRFASYDLDISDAKWTVFLGSS